MKKSPKRRNPIEDKKSEFTREEVEGFYKAELRGHKLCPQFDRAIQDVVMPMDLPSVVEAKNILNKRFGVDSRVVSLVMENFLNYHSKVIVDMPGHEKINIPKEQFHQFYSLIYYLLDQDDAFKAGRDAIGETFKVLGMGRELPETEVLAHIKDITAFSVPERGSSHR